jgi:hypothetical protein
MLGARRSTVKLEREGAAALAACEWHPLLVGRFLHGSVQHEMSPVGTAESPFNVKSAIRNRERPR